MKGKVFGAVFFITCQQFKLQALVLTSIFTFLTINSYLSNKYNLTLNQIMEKVTSSKRFNLRVLQVWFL